MGNRASAPFGEDDGELGGALLGQTLQEHLGKRRLPPGRGPSARRPPGRGSVMMLAAAWPRAPSRSTRRHFSDLRIDRPEHALGSITISSAASAISVRRSWVMRTKTVTLAWRATSAWAICSRRGQAPACGGRGRSAGPAGQRMARSTASESSMSIELLTGTPKSSRSPGVDHRDHAGLPLLLELLEDLRARRFEREVPRSCWINARTRTTQKRP